MSEARDVDAQILRILAADEQIHARSRSVNGEVAITDRRLVVAENERIALNVAIHSIRRIQFDIERLRPATLVIVPESPSDQPQVLSIPPEEYESTGHALALIGQRLAEPDPRA